MFKMASAFLFVITVLLLFQISVKAAPSELLAKLENTSTNEQHVKLDSEPNTLAVEDDINNSTTQQGQRQKRYYNYYGYGFPPVNPVIYPNYPRDDFPDYAAEPLQQIYRRLQDIAHVVRYPSFPPPPPPQSQFPLFFPVIYVPQIECACGTDQYVPPDQNMPTTPQPSDRNDTSDIDVENRFPEMEDERQNWGLVNNETEVDDGQEEDFTRPISFVPIRPNRTMTRPPPAVDHGSSQGGGNQGQTPTMTTTIRPGPPPPRPLSPAPNPPPSRPPVPITPQFRPPVPVEPPSACDGAVLSCCHQPEVTYDCFAVQGCPDLTSYGNPCDTQVILRVIDRFQRFYGRRTG